MRSLDGCSRYFNIYYIIIYYIIMRKGLKMELRRDITQLGGGGGWGLGGAENLIFKVCFIE